MLNSYPIKLLSFSAFVFVAAFFVAQKFFISVYLLVALTFFFSLLCLIANRRLSAALQDANRNKFTFTFLTFTGLKLFASLILLLVAIYLTPADTRFATGICVMGYYFLYTAFEASYWMRHLKAGN